MKNLLATMAFIEVAAGVAVALVPSLVSSLLLGAPLERPPALVIARLAGVALLSLGIACFMARSTASNAARGIIFAMLVYNLGATIVLGWARLGFGLGGVILWVVIAVHALLALWCAAVLRRGRSRETT